MHDGMLSTGDLPIKRKVSRPLSIIRESSGDDLLIGNDAPISWETDTSVSSGLDHQRQERSENSTSRVGVTINCPVVDTVSGHVVQRDAEDGDPVNTDQCDLFISEDNQSLAYTKSPKLVRKHKLHRSKTDSQNHRQTRVSRRKAVAPLLHPVYALNNDLGTRFSCDKNDDTNDDKRGLGTVESVENIKESFSSPVQTSEKSECCCEMCLCSNCMLNQRCPCLQNYMASFKKSRPDFCEKAAKNSFEIDDFLSKKELTSSPDKFSACLICRSKKPKAVDVIRDEFINFEKDNFMFVRTNSDSRYIVRKQRNKDGEKNAKGVLDQEQLAWREKVKESFSFPSLPDKFRPLRRSVGSFGSGTFLNSLALDVGGVRTEQETGVKFYLPGQKNSPDYLINPNTLVTHHPGKIKSTVTKISSVVSQLAGGREVTRSDDNNNSIVDFKQLSTCPKSYGPQNISEQSRDAGSKIKSECDHVTSVLTEVKHESGATRDVTPDSSDDYSILKETTTRLKLSTRRPSTLDWRARYVENDELRKRLRGVKAENKVVEDGPLTPERKRNINDMLATLRMDLTELHSQDQDLARQFLNIRQKMNKLKLAVHCQGHMTLLDNAEEEMAEVRELSRLVDLPVELLTSVSYLQHLGVTRMNITSRRFSTC
ncbi:uncharacterized protein LOC131942291 [Physella acuta]|uniref:uncharacterized protein LOC131942291 n=1 Tax=Physella acuta TaxID=109671 RepID=UPI0027DCC695|nr:uncharacterized protein LOC131942291 [Physella acuta]